MPSNAAMRAAKAIFDKATDGDLVAWDVLEFAKIIDREMSHPSTPQRRYKGGTFNNLCTRCGHGPDRHSLTDMLCPDHNWNVNCCGGVQK